MRLLWTSFVFVPLVFGCAAATASQPSPDACEIRAIETSMGMRLESVVYGVPGSTGSYSLSLLKSGPGGTSEVRQGGDYEIGPAGDAVVSVTEVSHNARDGYSAVMTVDDSYGHYRCEL